jgi:hypothetical protein
MIVIIGRPFMPAVVESTGRISLLGVLGMN